MRYFDTTMIIIMDVRFGCCISNTLEWEFILYRLNVMVMYSSSYKPKTFQMQVVLFHRLFVCYYI